MACRSAPPPGEENVPAGPALMRYNDFTTAEWHPVWWPARSSKPLLGGDPVLGGFDSHAAPPYFFCGCIPGSASIPICYRYQLQISILEQIEMKLTFAKHHWPSRGFSEPGTVRRLTFSASRLCGRGLLLGRRVEGPTEARASVCRFSSSRSNGTTPSGDGFSNMFRFAEAVPRSIWRVNARRRRRCSSFLWFIRFPLTQLWMLRRSTLKRRAT